jgi:hypothetical protein
MGWTEHEYMSQRPGFTDDLWMTIEEQRNKEAKATGGK